MRNDLHRGELRTEAAWIKGALIFVICSFHASAGYTQENGAPVSHRDLWQLLSDKDNAVATAIIAGVSAVVGFIGKLVVETVQGIRRSHKDKMTLRTAIIADLEASAQIIAKQIGYVIDDSNPRFIWVPVFTSHLPVAENTAKLGILSQEEVASVVFYFKTYQEHLGYVIRNADREPRSVSGFLSPLGYDLSEESRRKSLVWSQRIILEQSVKAIAVLGRKVGHKAPDMTQAIEKAKAFEEAKVFASQIE